MKRNTIFGAAALLVAGAAIGAGSVVSQNAMAASGGPAETNQLTMVSIGEDGSAIECTFEGADAEGLIPEPPAGVAVDAQPVVGNVVVGMGQLVPTDGSLPELPLPPAGELPAGQVPDGQVISGVVSIGAGVDGSEIMVDATPLETREGTAEECAALHDEAVAMAEAFPAGATVIGTDGVAVSGGAVQVSTSATKP